MRVANGESKPSLRLGDNQYLGSVIQAGKAQFPSPSLFVLFRPSVDWMVPTHTGEDHLFY